MKPTRVLDDKTLAIRKLAVGWYHRAHWVLRLPGPTDIEPDDAETIRQVRRYTMTPPKRVAALCNAVRYIVKHEIPGDIVECGVWRGGSMMAAALTALRQGDTSRGLWLYDTYTGMSPPSAADQSSAYDGYSLHKRWRRHQRDDGTSWHAVPVEHVRAAVESTGYPAERIRLLEGMVEDTIPASIPTSIALLRLDTDFYESTLHELEHLFPLLTKGGVLILDDYGHYEGARRAVDEYFEKSGHPMLLNRIDYTCRAGVKAF